MSKKLKKNLGNITKITRNNSQKKSNGAGSYIPSSPVRQTTKLNSNLVSKSQDYILCALLHTEKRHEYQEEMVRNYLQSARERFQHDKDLKLKQAEERKQKEEQKLKDLACVEGLSQCINPGCDQFGTAVTSYMCKACFERQRDQELTTINSPSLPRANNNVDSCAPRYGIGKSRFYTESDINSHNTISRLPSTRVGSNIDQTLYLSRSTFYNDMLSSSTLADNRSLYNPSGQEQTAKSGGRYENARNTEQELGVRPGMYIHELSPAMTKQDPGVNFQKSNLSRHESNINWQDFAVISGNPNVGHNIANRHNMPVFSGRYSCGYNLTPATQDISTISPTLRQDNAALTWQDQLGGGSSAPQRIHSYNLARSWDSSSSAGSRTSDRPAPLGRAGSQQEFSHVTVVRLCLFTNHDA